MLLIECPALPAANCGSFSDMNLPASRSVVRAAQWAFFAYFVMSNCSTAHAEPLDSGMLSSIRAGHKQLENNVRYVSGIIRHWQSNNSIDAEDPFSRDGLRQIVNAKFFVLDQMARLEYLPLDDAVQSPDGDSDEMESGGPSVDIVMENAEHAYWFMSVPSTGVPFANLSIYDDPAFPEVAGRVNSQLRYQLSSLYSIQGTSVLQILQLPNVSMELITFRGVNDVVRISGQTKPKSGISSNYSVILNPQEDYSVWMVDYRSTAPNWLSTMSGEIRPKRTKDGRIIPDEIAMQVESRSTSGGEVGPASLFRTVVQIQIDSFAKPSSALFDEKSFQDLGRDYAEIQVSATGERKDVGLVRAAPESAGFPDGEEEMSSSHPSRVLIAANVIVIMLLLMFLLRRYYSGKRT